MGAAALSGVLCLGGPPLFLAICFCSSVLFSRKKCSRQSCSCCQQRARDVIAVPKKTETSLLPMAHPNSKFTQPHSFWHIAIVSCVSFYSTWGQCNQSYFQSWRKPTSTSHFRNAPMPAGFHIACLSQIGEIGFLLMPFQNQKEGGVRKKDIP